MIDTEARRLAVRLKDDGIWKTANLRMRNVPFSAASTVANTGYGVQGRPVEETVLLYRISNAWETMLANNDRPLDEPMFQWYASLLGVSGAEYIACDAADPERQAAETFARLWSASPELAAISANHILVHADVGLFGVYPRQVGELEASMASQDRLERYVKDNAVELAPSGLTRERMRIHGEGR